MACPVTKLEGERDRPPQPSPSLIKTPRLSNGISVKFQLPSNDNRWGKIPTGPYEA